MKTFCENIIYNYYITCPTNVYFLLKSITLRWLFKLFDEKFTNFGDSFVLSGTFTPSSNA